MVVERWNLSPLAAAGSMLAIELLDLAFDVLLGRPLSRFTAGRSGLLFDILLSIPPITTFLAVRFYRQATHLFRSLYVDGLIDAPRNEYNRFLRRLDEHYNSPLLNAFVYALLALVVLSPVYGHRHDEYAWRGLLTVFRLISDIGFDVLVWSITLFFLAKAAITGFAIRRALHWPLHMQPLHADGVGGLHRITEISVTMGFVLAMGSTIFALVELLSPTRGQGIRPVLALFTAVLPLVFLGAIYEAHRAMVRARDTLLAQLDAVARPCFSAMCEALEHGKEDASASEELIRLNKVRHLIHDFPTWPLNTQTATQVTLSIAVPLGLVLLQVALEHFAKR